MAQIFGHTPEVLSNTVEAAERVEDFIKLNPLGMRLPKFPLPEGLKTPYEYMEKLAWEGLKRLKWDILPDHVEALKMELDDVKVARDINGMDFSTYFLIIQDSVNFCKSKGIRVGDGRGSGYASVLLRTLGICSGASPIKQKLIWERFLGFSQSQFVLDSDWGIGDASSEIQEGAKELELEEDRPVEEDQGGVDRIH